MSTSTAHTDPLSPGTRSNRMGGIVQRYHVHGRGPVCVAHSGGPGIFYDYLRMPALEEHRVLAPLWPQAALLEEATGPVAVQEGEHFLDPVQFGIPLGVRGGHGPRRRRAMPRCPPSSKAAGASGSLLGLSAPPNAKGRVCDPVLCHAPPETPPCHVFGSEGASAVSISPTTVSLPSRSASIKRRRNKGPRTRRDRCVGCIWAPPLPQSSSSPGAPSADPSTRPKPDRGNRAVRAQGNSRPLRDARRGPPAQHHLAGESDSFRIGRALEQAGRRQKLLAAGIPDMSAGQGAMVVHHVPTDSATVRLFSRP
ncbi:putative protein OS=Streptomyces aurantiogriseus OX=66870 GN=GCM10010251_25160 PE=4 SV=1 [Streptomyces aurantiogriseus]|uniref:Uncharacterized protein n=1 Tax=Streptomyces aurantiogriseus TaxID=66870 RepID=A0A918F4P8_9ACTN|nr:hypothetical protein GCM10010251_25160 [Streptomyces aurantiogriseus]